VTRGITGHLPGPTAGGVAVVEFKLWSKVEQS
jgi:hypothetical protein